MGPSVKAPERSPVIIGGMEKLRRLVRTPWQIAAAGLLAALVATTAYRAATQAISHDEGVMFEWFQAGPWSQLFGSPFGNHHPLTVLCSRVAIGFGSTRPKNFWASSIRSWSSR